MKNILHPRIVLVSVVIVVGFFLWWTLLRTTEVIDTITVERGDIELSTTALGVVQPRSYVDVGAQASGEIRRIHVQPGDVVHRGQLLVEIDPSVQQSKVDADRAALDSLRARKAAAEAQRTFAAQELDRQHRMADEGSTRAQDVQSAEDNFRVARAQLDDLRAQIVGESSTLKGDEAQLGYTRIYAPMDGTVVTLDAREGQTLNATYRTPTILRIADLSTMTIWTEVSEADVRRIRPGMPVYFTTLGEDRRWQGTVRQILPAPPNPITPAGAEAGQSPNAMPAVGKVVLYTVLFDVANADAALMPQMSAQVFFIQARATHVVVAPLTALTPIDGRPGWYTAEVQQASGNVIRRTVHTGVHDRLTAEVLSGLEVGERLVTAIRYERAAEGRFRW